MPVWIDAFQLPAEMYWRWMKARKNRQKARYYRKLERMTNRCFKRRNNAIKIEEERFVESMISLWIAQDAPEWIKDYVREELRKQRGLVTEPKKQSRYSEPIMDELIRCKDCKHY